MAEWTGPRISEDARRFWDDFLTAGTLLQGDHLEEDGDFCAMELIAFLSGEPWSDRPQCVVTSLVTIVQILNDFLNDTERQKLKPFIPRIMRNTLSSEEIINRAVRYLVVALYRHYDLYTKQVPSTFEAVRSEEALEILRSLSEATEYSSDERYSLGRVVDLIHAQQKHYRDHLCRIRHSGHITECDECCHHTISAMLNVFGRNGSQVDPDLFDGEPDIDQVLVRSALNIVTIGWGEEHSWEGYLDYLLDPTKTVSIVETS